MDDDPRLSKALARYQVVSAFLAADLTRGQVSLFREQLAKRTWIGPDGQPMVVTAETIRVWVRRYRKRGLDGLFDKERPSTGVQVLTPGMMEIACALKRKVPERTLDTLIRIMEDLGHVEPGVIRRSTLHRALQAEGLSRRPTSKSSTDDLDRWEAFAPNDLWQADMRTGPWLPDPSQPGKVRKTWLYAFIDDHSRLVLDARFSFKGDLPALELCLRRAVQKWGVPRKCYYDNGQTFRSQHMRYICGRLDIQHPVHTTPYRPEGHGKIEAFNKLMLGFIAEVNASSIKTLEELNEALRAWLDLNYQSEVHGGTGEAPRSRERHPRGSAWSGPPTAPSRPRARRLPRRAGGPGAPRPSRGTSRGRTPRHATRPSRLSGLRSRCTTPRPCAYARCRRSTASSATR